jgi:hypothetical protein
MKALYFTSKSREHFDERNFDQTAKSEVRNKFKGGQIVSKVEFLESFHGRIF